MIVLSTTQGHIHDPSSEFGSIRRCRHCNRHIVVNESNSAWEPVQFERSDFVRRIAGEYIIPHPDREDSWLACVWQFGPGMWRHDRMMLSAPAFKTMREAIADRVS